MEDWQKQRIQKNLVKLIEQTACNPQLITFLKANEVLGQVDVEFLEAEKTPYEKSKTLYEILPTRVDSFNILLQALESTNQSGALEILKERQAVFRNYGTISVDQNYMLGKGNSGTKVYRGKFDGRDVAVKVFNPYSIDINLVLKEVEFLKKLDNHENIVRYFIAEAHKEFVCVALELCKINLQDQIKKNLLQLNPLTIVKECTKGLAHIHQQNVIHGDLRPANVLLTEKGHAKITNFQLSEEIPVGMTSVKVSYTRRIEALGWMAPELLKFIQSTASDIFSLGCLHFFILTNGSHPFGASESKQTNIYNGKPQLENPKIASVEWLKLIEWMIAHDSGKRPSAPQVLSSIRSIQSTNSEFDKNYSSIFTNIFHTDCIYSQVGNKTTCSLMVEENPPEQAVRLQKEHHQQSSSSSALTKSHAGTITNESRKASSAEKGFSINTFALPSGNSELQNEDGESEKSILYIDNDNFPVNFYATRSLTKKTRTREPTVILTGQHQQQNVLPASPLETGYQDSIRIRSATLKFKTIMDGPSEPITTYDAIKKMYDAAILDATNHLSKDEKSAAFLQMQYYFEYISERFEEPHLQSLPRSKTEKYCYTNDKMCAGVIIGDNNDFEYPGNKDWNHIDSVSTASKWSGPILIVEKFVLQEGRKLLLQMDKKSIKHTLENIKSEAEQTFGNIHHVFLIIPSGISLNDRAELRELAHQADLINMSFLRHTTISAYHILIRCLALEPNKLILLVIEIGIKGISFELYEKTKDPASVRLLTVVEKQCDLACLQDATTLEFREKTVSEVDTVTETTEKSRVTEMALDILRSTFNKLLLLNDGLRVNELECLILAELPNREEMYSTFTDELVRHGINVKSVHTINQGEVIRATMTLSTRPQCLRDIIVDHPIHNSTFVQRKQ